MQRAIGGRPRYETDGGSGWKKLNTIKLLGIRTGGGLVHRSREFQRRENVIGDVACERSPEVCGRTARFLGVSEPRSQAETIHLVGTGGGRETGGERSLGEMADFCGSDPTRPSFATFRVSSTTQIDVTFDTSRLRNASWPSSFALLPHGSCDPRQLEGRPLNRHRRRGCAKQPDCPVSGEMADF